MARLLITALSLIGLLFPSTRVFSAPPDIRVLVVEDAASINITSLGQALRIRDQAGGDDETIGKSARATSTKAGISVNGEELGKEVEILNSERKYKIGDKTFFGTITLVWKSASSLMVVCSLPMERYLVGIIGSEISPSWPVESIKAQAVAARTYAINKINSEGTRSDYDIASTVLAQVYHGSHVEDAKAKDAVELTRGEVLTRAGKVFPAFYHSCCGGRTERAHNVWKNAEGPPPIEDKYCARSPKLNWSYSITSAAFSSAMSQAGFPLGAIESVDTSIFGDSPRVENLLVEDEFGLKMIPATEVRRIIGYKEVRSTWFDAGLSRGSITFTGKGYGHGVGMCQFGAKGMADAGFSYRDILKFYYPDAELTKAY